MACITDGMLRAQLDGELSQAELVDVKKHCDSCEKCRHRATTIARDAERVRGILSTLGPLEGDALLDPRIAFAQFQARQAAEQRQSPSFASTLFAKRLAPAWATLAATCLIAAVLTFAPARSWAQRILAMLRVQKIMVVPLDFEALSNPSDRARLGKTMAQLISDDVVFTLKAGEPESAETQEQAAAIAGFKVRLLRKLEDFPQVKIVGEQSFHMTVDRDRLQSILDEAGRSDLQFPFALDGATIRAHIPKIVFAQYGYCGRRSNEDAPPAEARGGIGCIDLVQSPSPTVTVPPELNMAQLAEVALQLGGMSPQAARQFSQSVDWTTTLVLGIPQGTSYRTVQVDGVQGTLIEESRRRERGHYTLVWVKDGIVYALRGSGDSGDALTLAESLN